MSISSFFRRIVGMGGVRDAVQVGDVLVQADARINGGTVLWRVESVTVRADGMKYLLIENPAGDRKKTISMQAVEPLRLFRKVDSELFPARVRKGADAD